MIKTIHRTDVVSRPFKTFKRWELQNIDPDDIILTEFGDNLSVTYETASIGDVCNLDSSSLAPEHQDFFQQRFLVEHGTNISGTFFDSSHSYYNPITNPKNWNGSYERLVYSANKHLFYNNFNNPLYLHGLENYETGSNGEHESRNIHDEIIVGSVPYKVFGEKIRPYTVRIADNSNPDDQVILVDDGYTNLVTSGAFFRDLPQRISPWVDPYYRTKEHYFYNPNNDRFGTSVASWQTYVLVGAPMDEECFSNHLAGSAHLFKFDPTESKYRFVKNFYSPWSQNSLSHEKSYDSSELIMSELGFCLIPEATKSVNDKFGSAISINDDMIAVGATNTNYCGEYSGSGHVFVYDKYKGGSENWGLTNVLQGSQSMDRFGCSVALSGSMLAIGASGAFGGQGAVYIYRKEIYGVTIPTSSMWVKMVPEGSRLCETLGAEDNDQNTIYLENPSPKYAVGNTIWMKDYVITASDGQAGDGFGGKVAIDGNNILVGGLISSSSPPVYLFGQLSSGSWSYTGSLSGSEDYGYEGWHGLDWESGSWIPGTYEQTYKFTSTGIYSGSSQVFLTHSIDLTGNNTFYPTPIVKVTSSFDGFGQGISIYNDVILIGSPSGRVYYEYQGATTLYTSGEVYAFRINQSGSWELVELLYGEGQDSRNNNFGYAVNINKDHLAIGSVLYPTTYKLSYESGNFYVENFRKGSIGPLDGGTGEEWISGRVFVYDKFYDTQSLQTTWSLQKVVKKLKQRYDQKLKFGNDIALGTNNVLAVGAPLVLQRETTSSIYTDQTILRYNMAPELSQSVSGSVFLYNLGDMNFQAGNVFYKNGIFIITDTGSAAKNILSGHDGSGFNVQFNGTNTINENEVLCKIEPGEFNVSTNPSAVNSGRALYDINNDGIFDFTDLSLIINYILNGSGYVEIADQNTIIIENTSYVTDRTWWNDDIIMTESEDSALVLATVADESEAQVLAEKLAKEKEINDYLKWLLDNGYLDVDGNGRMDKYDAKIILNYYLGKRGYGMIKGLTDNNSTRKFAQEISDYLDEMTGKNLGKMIKSDFMNYAESSSIDPTGSYLAPYVTTVGIYSGLDMVAVAKLGQPIKIGGDYPINIRVVWDN